MLDLGPSAPEPGPSAAAETAPETEPASAPESAPQQRLARSRRATFAAGCFWGVEAVFSEIDGVLSTRVGFTGGDTPSPSYRQVCGHDTGHAEAVEIWFDPELVSYEQLLETFWRIHNPTTPSRQGWDLGDQYRSAIFVHDAGQEALAKASRDAEQESLTKPIVTRITPAGPFYEAEEHHQRYFEKHNRQTLRVR
ncbi:MAG: peptide-methionine (S)-S-oxide reductase MsrA [Solirubrobacteraceae bacterium]